LHDFDPDAAAAKLRLCLPGMFRLPLIPGFSWSVRGFQVLLLLR
jgi:hypothetical protein